MNVRIDADGEFTVTPQQMENTRKWIDELRSNKYEQGQSYLCMEEHFCCLGVAASYVFDLKSTIKDEDGVRTYEIDLEDFGSTSYDTTTLPGCFIYKKLGIPTYSMLYTTSYGDDDDDDVDQSGRTFVDCCVQMNDADYLTFGEIAYVIETFINKYAIVKE